MPTQVALEGGLDHIARIIQASTNLHELLTNLRTFEHVYNEAEISEDCDPESALQIRGVDLCELPTFGGSQPANTFEVWSWDNNDLLVGVGSFSEWRIVDRSEWKRAHSK